MSIPECADSNCRNVPGHTLPTILLTRILIWIIPECADSNCCNVPRLTLPTILRTKLLWITYVC